MRAFSMSRKPRFAQGVFCQNLLQTKALTRWPQASQLSKVLLAGTVSVFAVVMGIGPALAGVAVAQNPDFPDLPILQPAIPLSAPVSVPPIDMRILEEPPVQPVPAQAAAPAPIDIPVVRSPDLPEVEQPVADVPASGMPSEVQPPFIGEVSTPVVEAPEAPPFIEAVEIPVVEAPVAKEPTVEAPVVEAPVVEVPIVEAPVVAEPAVATIVPADPLPAVEADAGLPATAPQPPNDNFERAIANANPAVSVIPVAEMPVAEAQAAEIPAVERSAERVSAAPASAFVVTPAATTNRWPEPLTFGQPLP
jgi:hypothetical protein